MRNCLKLFALLLFAWPVFAQTNVPGTTDPCQTQGILKQSAFINVATATTTAIVAAPTSAQPTAVYVCSFDITMGGATVAADAGYFEGGTGSSCASNIVILSATYTTGILAANAPFFMNRNGPGMLFKTALGSGLCFVSTTVATTAPTI